MHDHLGNVRQVYGDARYFGTDGSNAEAGLMLKEQTSYYPFGMQIATLSYSREDYTFGMQGMIRDDEMKGKGNSISFKYRDYDPRIGRMKSLDPLRAKYPFWSAYAFSGNRVIDSREQEGLQPTQSGSYGGEGAIAPEMDDNGKAIAGTDEQRWAWNEGAWNQTQVGVTKNELTSLFPNGNLSLLQTIETTLNLESLSYGIDTQIELNGFIAQTGFETAGFTKLTEEVHRYTLKNIRSLFTRKDDFSDEYVKSKMKDPDALAVFLYEGTGNGVDYRGRGLIHTTWIDNYRVLSNRYNSRYGTNYDFTKTPFLVASDYQIAVRSGLIYFEVKGLFGLESYNINAVSSKVNYYDEPSFPRRQSLFKKVNSIIK